MGCTPPRSRAYPSPRPKAKQPTWEQIDRQTGVETLPSETSFTGCNKVLVVHNSTAKYKEIEIFHLLACLGDKMAVFYYRSQQ